MKINIGNDLYLKGRIGWKGLSKDEYLSDSNYRIINGYSLKEGYIDWEIAGFISKERYEESPEIMLKVNDILISKDGTIGKVGIVRDLISPTTVASGIFVLRNIIEDKLDTEYLFQYLKSSYFKSFINSVKAEGSTINHLYQRDLIRLEIDVPKIDLQRKISKVLSDLDTKIELNNRINRELEAMAKTLYDYWFVQFDFPNEQGKPYKSSGGKMVYNKELKREIPLGWEVKKIENFCRIFTGKKDVNQALEVGRYKFYSCSPNYKFSNDKLYEGKAILISGNGSYTGRTIFVDEGFDLYQRTYACINKTETDILPYLYYSILRFLSLKIGGGTHGSAIPYIVYDDIAKEVFSYKIEVISTFQEIIYPILRQIKNTDNQTIKLTELRDWLLPMLMNGQVTVKEAEESLSMAAESNVEYKKG